MLVQTKIKNLFAFLLLIGLTSFSLIANHYRVEIQQLNACSIDEKTTAKIEFENPKMVYKDFGVKQGWTTTNHVRTLADVNGDGKADIVGFSQGGTVVALSTGRSFGPLKMWIKDFGTNQGWTVQNHVRTLADVNGDGKADIVGFSQGGTVVALSTGRGFGPLKMWIKDFGTNQGWTVKNHHRTLADVNGDGKADIVGFTGGGTFVALSTGKGFSKGEQWVKDFGIDQGWTNKNHVRALGDLNGDGLDDIIGFSGQVRVGINVPTLNSFGVSKPLGKKLLFGSELGYGAFNKSMHPRVVADVNGDGKIDAIGYGQNGVFVALSKGDGTFSPQEMVIANLCIGAGGWEVSKHPRTAADVNGDGKADLVGFGEGGVFVAFAK
jgi:hypothetical protein